MLPRLELVLGIPAQFWNNLEMIYREKLIKVKAENEMDEDLEIIKKIPYNEMAKNGWVEATRNPRERVINARKFFEVVHLGLVQGSLVPSIACRKLGGGEKIDYALIAWAQRAKVVARNVPVSPINIAKLKTIVPEIREMTTQNPAIFCSVLCEKLAACGVALIFLPHIGGSFLHGATFYDGPKIVVGMTVRVSMRIDSGLACSTKSGILFSDTLTRLKAQLKQIKMPLMLSREIFSSPMKSLEPSHQTKISADLPLFLLPTKLALMLGLL